MTSATICRTVINFNQDNIMGSGVSTVGIHHADVSDINNNKIVSEPNLDQLVRLRRALLLRTYNISRKNNTGREGEEQITLAEQLKVCTHRHPVDNRLLIEPSELQKYLSLDAPWANNLFKQVIGNENEIEFKDLIEFLESGKIPNRSIIKNESQKNIDKDLLISKSTHNTPRNSTNAKISKSSSSGVLISPGRIRSTKKANNEIENDDLTASPSVDSTEQSSYNDDDNDVNTGLELTLHKNEIIYQGPVRPLWRKREVVRQERTVEYITIDADGIKQELVEKEISQTEVLHMECRETGEFAHRETTQYEQLETFNDEVVVEEHGTEEYVHLKSLDDEVEYMKSNMPKKEQTPGDAPQQSPRVGQSYDNTNNNYNHNNNEGMESPKVYDQQEGTEVYDNDIRYDDDEELAQQIREYMELEMREGRNPDPGGFIRMKLAEKNDQMNNIDEAYHAHDEDLAELLRLQKEEDEYLAALEREQEQQDQQFDYDQYQNEIDEEVNQIEVPSIIPPNHQNINDMTEVETPIQVEYSMHDID